MRPKSAGRLEQVLRAGEFAITAEMGPPDSVDPADVLAHAGCLKGLADAVNVLDGAGARAHLSPLATAAILAREGIEPVLQLTMRDRNRLALQADVLGAAALGVHSLLCLTGDSVDAGDQPETKPVFDLKSNEFMALVRTMRDEAMLPGGRGLASTPRLLIGGADAPREPKAGDTPTSLQAKIEAGADFFQTQFCFDMSDAAALSRLARGFRHSRAHVDHRRHRAHTIGTFGPLDERELVRCAYPGWGRRPARRRQGPAGRGHPHLR